MERLYVEAARALNSLKGKTLAAAAAPPPGPQPSLLQVVEAMQDAWWVAVVVAHYIWRDTKALLPLCYQKHVFLLLLPQGHVPG